MRLLIPLFSPATGTWGGLTRAVAVAHAAEAAGHRVAFCAAGYLGQNLRDRGYRVYPMPAPTMLGLPKPLSALLTRLSVHMAAPVRLGRSLGSIWLVLAFAGVLNRRYLARLARAELRAARDYAPDAIFTDLDPGAFLVARSLNVPIATAYASVMRTGIDSRAYRRAQRAIAPVLAHCGLPALTPEQLLFDESVLKIVPSIPELDDADPKRPDVRYVGHLLGAVQPGYPDGYTPEPGRRYVFCYMGTGSMPLGEARRVLVETFAHDERICLVASYGIERQERVGNVLFCPYVDVRTLLPHCDWTICHGGQNTIIQSLQAGVSLLIFPGAIFERRLNAERVQAQGAGVLGEPEDWHPEWLRQQLDRHEPAASAATRLGVKIDALGGAPAAIEALEAWVRRSAWQQENARG